MKAEAGLTIAFLARRPLAAARELAAMDADDAAAFLDTIPIRFSARALAHMGAWPAAILLTRMDAEHGAGVLRELSYQDAAAILRLAAPGARSLLLTRLPARLRRDFETSLSFPEDTVGAHMNVAVVTLSRGHTVADACDQIRRAGIGSGDQQQIFVLDNTRRLAGVVPISALLHYTLETTVGDLAHADIATISARARVAEIADLADWDEHGQLPVVSRRGHFIGALTRRSMRRATEVPISTGADREPALAAALAGSMLASGFGLLKLLLPLSGAEKQSPDAGKRS